jgi:ArsR family transcriptional regulator, arsenate/arsenite/antimonite-responsive transcriptional repressor
MITKPAAAKLSDEQFQAIGHAVADPRRFAILQQIAAADNCITCGALEEHEVISAPTISHHLKELSEAGLIRVERDGRSVNLFFCRTVWQAYLKRLALL